MQSDFGVTPGNVSYDAYVHSATGIRTGGAWFAIASCMMIFALVLHAVPSPSAAEFMRIIASEGAKWAVAHWFAALALSFYVVASFIILASRTRLTAHWSSMSAWAILAVGALWVSITAVLEATAVAQVAATGDLARYEPWESLAEGLSMGFLGIALGIGVIAAQEARSALSTMPVWASWIGAAAAGLAAIGWIMAPIGGIEAGGLLWLLSTIVASLWGVWFGVNVARSKKY